jgi:hypothetical protein
MKIQRKKESLTDFYADACELEDVKRYRRKEGKKAESTSLAMQWLQTTRTPPRHLIN